MQMTADAITRRLEIAARPEAVWAFLVDPEKATRWMGVAADLYPRPGGIYRVEVLPGQVAEGEFVELDPPRRLVHTFGWEPGANSDVRSGTTTVEIELEPTETGTILHFTHRDLPDEAAADSHAVGWDHYLARLVTAAAGGDAGRDPWMDR
jgi:uncharacterized protein YndB with AHSA1/START domain